MSEETEAADPRRIVLVGFMGSGKSTVGPLVAAGLGWRFVDSDAVVVETAGRSVSMLFTEVGEPGFRELEHRIMRRLLTQDHVVIASGGGWPIGSGTLDEAPEGTISVWLGVGAETAVERVRVSGVHRPLLEGPDPVGTARSLLASRNQWYARSHMMFDTEKMNPRDISESVIEAIETVRQSQ